jgi:thymidine kinase
MYNEHLLLHGTKQKFRAKLFYCTKLKCYYLVIVASHIRMLRKILCQKCIRLKLAFVLRPFPPWGVEGL